MPESTQAEMGICKEEKGLKKELSFPSESFCSQVPQLPGSGLGNLTSLSVASWEIYIESNSYLTRVASRTSRRSLAGLRWVMATDWWETD